MFLTMAKYQENLLKDSTLSLLFIVKFYSSLKTKMMLKTPNETFLKITRYQLTPGLMGEILDCLDGNRMGRFHTCILLLPTL